MNPSFAAEEIYQREQGTCGREGQHGQTTRYKGAEGQGEAKERQYKISGDRRKKLEKRCTLDQVILVIEILQMMMMVMMIMWWWKWL